LLTGYDSVIIANIKANNVKVTNFK